MPLMSGNPTSSNSSSTGAERGLFSPSSKVLPLLKYSVTYPFWFFRISDTEWSVSSSLSQIRIRGIYQFLVLFGLRLETKWYTNKQMYTKTWIQTIWHPDILEFAMIRIPYLPRSVWPAGWRKLFFHGTIYPLFLLLSPACVTVGVSLTSLGWF